MATKKKKTARAKSARKPVVRRKPRPPLDTRAYAELRKYLNALLDKKHASAELFEARQFDASLDAAGVKLTPARRKAAIAALAKIDMESLQAVGRQLCFDPKGLRFN
jgi:hypothetical protein